MRDYTGNHARGSNYQPGALVIAKMAWPTDETVKTFTGPGAYVVPGMEVNFTAPCDCWVMGYLTLMMYASAVPSSTYWGTDSDNDYLNLGGLEYFKYATEWNESRPNMMIASLAKSVSGKIWASLYGNDAVTYYIHGARAYSRLIVMAWAAP